MCYKYLTSNYKFTCNIVAVQKKQQLSFKLVVYLKFTSTVYFTYSTHTSILL